jgi:hypothetical protein
MIQDLRLAIRMLRRSLGFSCMAILCLTLGIGATTSVLSWIEGILLRPFPLVRDQERLVAVTGLDRTERDDVSWPDFQDLKKNSTLTETFIAERISGTTLNIGKCASRHRYCLPNVAPNIIGRTQLMNGVKHTIIGVAPPGFYGTFVGCFFQF